jgi:hypothetical protein
MKNQKAIFAIPQRPGVNTQTWSCETGSRESFSFLTELDVYLTTQHYWKGKWNVAHVGEAESP